MVEHPAEPHQHCPICLAPVIGEEDSDESRTNATAHFKAEHPEVYASIKSKIEVALQQLKAQSN